MSMKNQKSRFPSIYGEKLFIYNTDSLEAIDKGRKIEIGFLIALGGIKYRGIPIVREHNTIKIALPLYCHERKDRMREMEAIGIYATQNEISFSKLLTEGGVKIQEETERVTGGFIGYREIVPKTYDWLEKNSGDLAEFANKNEFAIYFSPVKKNIYPFIFENWEFDKVIVIS